MAWICSCNALNTAAVNGAIAAQADEPHLRPSQVYRQLGVKPQCGICSPTIRDMITAARQTTTATAPHHTKAQAMPEPVPHSPSAPTSPAHAASPVPTGCEGCIKAQMGQCARQLASPVVAERPDASSIVHRLRLQAAR